MFKYSGPRDQDVVQIKTFKNHLLRNQGADDLETWYTASGTQAQPDLFEWCWVDIDHIFDMVKFVS